MKLNRWIIFPLIYTLIYVIWMIFWYWVWGLPFGSFMIWLWLIGGLLFGFFILAYSDIKAKKLSNNSDDERIYDAKQDRNLILLLNYDKSFELCRDAILSIKKGKIKTVDIEQGVIKASCRVKWDMPRQKIEIRLKRVNENMTEIELFVRPHMKTVLIGSGYNWKIAEDLCAYLKANDAEINKKILADSVSIMEDVYIKPFQKEKFEK